jgi:hypothetical protein
MIWSHTGKMRQIGSVRSSSCPLMTQTLGSLPRTSLAIIMSISGGPRNFACGTVHEGTRASGISPLLLKSSRSREIGWHLRAARARFLCEVCVEFPLNFCYEDGRSESERERVIYRSQSMRAVKSDASLATSSSSTQDCFSPRCHMSLRCEGFCAAKPEQRFFEWIQRSAAFPATCCSTPKNRTRTRIDLSVPQTDARFRLRKVNITTQDSTQQNADKSFYMHSPLGDFRGQSTRFRKVHRYKIYILEAPHPPSRRMQ